MPSSPDEQETIISDPALPSDESSLHTTCPPEELRQSLSHRSDEPQANTVTNRDHNRPANETEEDADPKSNDMDDMAEGVTKDTIRDSPSPCASQEPLDARLAQPVPPAALGPQSSSLDWPLATTPVTRVAPNSSSSCLRPGSKFVGTQQSDRQRYNVSVEIKYVDMEQSFLCGYLKIQGLTEDHPTLTTYFEGEIIGNKHTFKTAHPSWGSSEKVDMQHWARFPAWLPLAKSAKSPAFTYQNYAQREHIFMRWKERFLVPDHKVKTISGASFEGFYYICFNQCTGGVSGIYFHAKSEKYQQLELEHVSDRGCAGSMEFR